MKLIVDHKSQPAGREILEDEPENHCHFAILQNPMRFDQKFCTMQCNL